MESETADGSPGALSLGWIIQSIASWILVWVVVALWMITVGVVFGWL